MAEQNQSALAELTGSARLNAELAEARRDAYGARIDYELARRRADRAEAEAAARGLDLDRLEADWRIATGRRLDEVTRAVVDTVPDLVRLLRALLGEQPTT
jgi:hypothetical protein